MCKDVCGHVTEFECASFEYSPVNRFCQLNDVNRWTAEENYVYFDQSWDYYHKTCYICRYICTILLLCYTKYCTILLLCYTKYTLCYTKYTLSYGFILRYMLFFYITFKHFYFTLYLIFYVACYMKSLKIPIG
jgi:hypothetical protein